MNAILGGHVDLTDSNLTQKGKVEAGQLKFLAIATEKRHPEMPNVPTLKELGVNVVYDVNRGLMVPKGTPARRDRASSATACASRGQGAGVRPGDEAAGHRRALHGPRGVRRSGSSKTDDENQHHRQRSRPAEALRLVARRLGRARGARREPLLFALTLGLKDSPLVPIGPGFYPRIVLGLSAVLGAALVLIDLVTKARPRPPRQGRLRRRGAALRDRSALYVARAAVARLSRRHRRSTSRRATRSCDRPTSAQAWAARRGGGARRHRGRHLLRLRALPARCCCRAAAGRTSSHVRAARRRARQPPAVEVPAAAVSRHARRRRSAARCPA